MSVSSSRRLRRARAWALVPTVAAAALLLPPTSPAQAADPVAGGQTSGDSLFPNVGNSGYDVAHYDLDLAWTPGATLAASTVDATAAIRATTTGAPLSSYSFDFEGPGLTVASVTVNGAPATWTRDEQPAQIRHKLVVTPATPVSGEFTTVVTYAGVPSRHVDADGSFEGWNVTADGATFVNQPIGSMTGFPNNNTPSDKATYTLDIDVPATITNAAGTGAAAAASNGELVDTVTSPDGTRKTWRWVQQEQMASELVIISIGKYDVLESDITLASGRTLHEWSFVDSAISATTKANINTQRARQKGIYDALETVFGPYPGNSVGVVVDTVPSAINYALETQDRSFFPSSISANTLVHEIAHQWWGNGVAPKDWNDLWINEGMATWTPTYFNNVLANPPTSTTSTHASYYNSWNSSAASSSNWRTPPARITNAAQLYGYQTYTRSAQQWEALRLSIGDADFFRFVREWQRRYDGLSRGTLDYIALAEEVSGEELDAFFQDWLFDPDKPAWPQRYDLSLASSRTDTAKPGDQITYTLTAANMGRVALSPAGGAASVVEVDLSDVLDDAALDVSSLPAGLTLNGTTLTWTVPTTAAAVFVPTGAATPTSSPSSTVSFPVVVRPEATQAAITATADSATLGGFCATAGGCTTSVAVPTQSLAPTAAPVVTGAPRVGSPLTATTEGWAPGTTFTYQWAVDGTPVTGATASTYTPSTADLGGTVTVAVTGNKAGYFPVTRTSAPSAAVAEGDLAPGTPSITGVPQVGRALTAATGDWADGTAFTYQWSVAGQPVPGATDETFVPRPGDLGETVVVAVTGTKAGYADQTRTSAPSAPVAAGELASTPTPGIDGVARVGRVLTAQPGTWDDGVALSYAWTRDGHPISGATSRSYRLTAVDADSVVRVTVTGSKAGYAPASRVSPARSVALGIQQLVPTPRVTGAAKVGRTLTVVPGAHDAGVRLAFRWYVGGEAVRGPRGAGRTYAVRVADRGDRIRVQVVATKPGYVSTTTRSAATPRVR